MEAVFCAEWLKRSSLGEITPNGGAQMLAMSGEGDEVLFNTFWNMAFKCSTLPNLYVALPNIFHYDLHKISNPLIENHFISNSICLALISRLF